MVGVRFKGLLVYVLSVLDRVERAGFAIFTRVEVTDVAVGSCIWLRE